jgi:hypothetical protein
MILDERATVFADRAKPPTEFAGNDAYAIRLNNLMTGEGSVGDFAGPPLYMAPDGWNVDASFFGVTDISRRSQTGHPLESIEISLGHFTPGDVSFWHRTFEYPEGFDGPINVKVHRVINSISPDGTRHLNVREETSIGSVEENGDITGETAFSELNPKTALAIVEDEDTFLINFLNAQHNATLPSPIAYK